MLGRETSPYAPLPGTRRSPRALFLDRWGTLFQPRESRPVRSAEELRFADHATEGLFRACREGWLLYLIGNEDDVAHGRLSDAEWRSLQDGTLAHIRSLGVAIQRDYTCVDDPVDGVAGHRGDSVYRLPNTGAFYHAAHTDGVELRRSWVVGDSTLELVAGWRASCNTLGLTCGEGLADGSFHVDPDLRADSLAEGLAELLGLARSTLH